MPKETFDLDVEIQKMRNGIAPSEGAFAYAMDLGRALHVGMAGDFARLHFIQKYGVSPSQS